MSEISYAEKRTKSHFKQALSSLVKEIGYSKITVKKLVDTADYNRTSFYKYFDNLEHITDELVEDIINHFFQISKKGYGVNKTINMEKLSLQRVVIFEEIYKAAPYYDLLAIKDTLPYLKTRFITTIEELLTNEIFFLTPDSEIYNSEYLIAFRAYGTFGFIEKWIKNRYSTAPETLAADIIAIYTRPFTFSQQQ